MNFIKQYLSEANQIIEQLDLNQIEQAVDLLAKTRETRVAYLF